MHLPKCIDKVTILDKKDEVLGHILLRMQSIFDRGVMRKQKEDEILAQEKTVREMQKAKFGPEGALFEKRQELVAPIQEQVYTAIEEYATDKGYDYIFDSGGATGIIFANPRYDKTDEVKKKLGIK